MPVGRLRFKMKVHKILYGLLSVCILYQIEAATVPVNSTTEPIVCSNENGVTGKCVHFYRCNDPWDRWTIIRPQDEPCAEPEMCCIDFIEKTAVTMKEGCGWANPKGYPASNTVRHDANHARFAEYPWVCAVMNKSTDQKPVYLGGGSLIHPSVVLTAAHLIAKNVLVASQMLIRAGEFDTQTDQEIYPHQDRDVKTFVMHEDFSRRNLSYNVALLFLERPVDLAPNVGVVCLPPPPSHQTPARATSDCVATGWGKDVFGKEGRYAVILKQVVIPIVDHEKCQEDLRKTRLGPKFNLHNTFLCAGGEEGKDTCIGDGGSPLACPLQEPDRYVQAGIVAWGIGCSGPVPGVYVDVAKQRDWIDNRIIKEGYDTKVYSF